jgi:hypothetical protein
MDATDSLVREPLRRMQLDLSLARLRPQPIYMPYTWQLEWWV